MMKAVASGSTARARAAQIVGRASAAGAASAAQSTVPARRLAEQDHAPQQREARIAHIGAAAGKSTASRTMAASRSGRSASW